MQMYDIWMGVKYEPGTEKHIDKKKWKGTAKVQKEKNNIQMQNETKDRRNCSLK